MRATSAALCPRHPFGLGLVVSALVALAGCGGSLPVSDHCDGSRFFNPGVDNDKSLADLVEWLSTRDPRPWPVHVEGRAVARVRHRLGASELAATWVGHSTFLVQIGPVNVLTDPIFSDRAGPVSGAGPLRVRRPGLVLDELPHVDVVLVSHDHYDHLDLSSVRQLDHRFRPLFVVPLGVGRLLLDEGVHRVVELDWWQSVTVDEPSQTTLTLAPALHWSGRGLFDRFSTLWGSHYLRNAAGRSVYFAGDTGYGSHFASVRERLGAPEVAMLPIGAYAPEWFMRDNHMGPGDAVRARLDLGARHSIPMHFGTFRLTDEGYDEPLRELEAARTRERVSFEALEVGASWTAPTPSDQRSASDAPARRR